MSRRTVLSTLGAIVLASSIVGCSPAEPPTGPSGSSDASTVPTSSPVASRPGADSAVGQTRTEWGVIWDAVPAGFPVFAGATIADDAGAGPASATYGLDGGDTAEIATYYQAALEDGRFSTEAFSGPLEDGSYLIDSVGDGDCRIATTITPQGGLHLVTVLYGASCPAP